MSAALSGGTVASTRTRVFCQSINRPRAQFRAAAAAITEHRTRRNAIIHNIHIEYEYSYAPPNTTALNGRVSTRSRLQLAGAAHGGRTHSPAYGDAYICSYTHKCELIRINCPAAHGHESRGAACRTFICSRGQSSWLTLAVDLHRVRACSAHARMHAT